MKNHVSRRNFLGATAGGAAASAIPAPAQSAVQSAGLKPGDLVIKEVKVYVLKDGRPGRGEAAGTQQFASLVTNNGIEGNYTLAPRYFHPNWSNLGWLDYAKMTVRGKSALDLPAIT